jgi:hypothetical protein
VQRLRPSRVRVADGPRSHRHGHVPGEEVWVIGEWRRSGERKYYLNNFPPRTCRGEKHPSAGVEDRGLP